MPCCQGVYVGIYRVINRLPHWYTIMTRHDKSLYLAFNFNKMKQYVRIKSKRQHHNAISRLNTLSPWQQNYQSCTTDNDMIGGETSNTVFSTMWYGISPKSLVSHQRNHHRNIKLFISIHGNISSVILLLISYQHLFSLTQISFTEEHIEK